MGGGGAPPAFDRHDLEQLQKGFEAEGAGTDGILVEVGLEEPLFGVDPLRSPDEAEPLGAAVGDEELDGIDHAQLLVGEGGVDRVGEGLASGNLLGARLVGLGVAHPDLLGEGGGGEEAEDRIAGVDRPLGVADLEVVALDDHAAAAGDAGDLDAGGQRPRLGRHRPVLHGVAVEVAEAQVDVAGQGAAEVGGEPAAGLQAGFEKDREGHLRLAAGGEIPGVGRDVVLGLDRYARHQLPRFAVDGDDAVEELEGRAGQPGDSALPVEDPVGLAEGLRRITGGKGENLLVIVEGRTPARDQSGGGRL